MAESALRAAPASAAVQMVDLTSDQTIGGVKTFTAAPIVPIGAFPQTAISGLDAKFAAKQDLVAPGTYVDTAGTITGLTTVAKTANYTAAAGEDVLADATAGSFTIMLPTAPPDGTRVQVKFVAGGSNVVTISAGGSDHIDQSITPPGGGFGDVSHAYLNAVRPGSDGQFLLFRYVAASSTWFVRDSLLSETVVLHRKVAGDPYDRWQLLADGTQLAGDGTAAPSQVSYVSTHSALPINGRGGNAGVTAFGLHAGEKSRDNGSTCFGYMAMPNNNPGDGCVALGFEAMRMAVSAADNTAVGWQALRGIGDQTGSGNAAFGCESMLQAATTSYTAAFGAFSYFSLTAGTMNVGVGTNTGYAPAGVTANGTTTANRQTLVGAETGQGSATQRNNITAIGYRALCNGDYATAVGSGASAGAAGSVAIGVDNTGAPATTTKTNTIEMGTALHLVDVPGALGLAAGSLVAPSLRFTADPTTGLYQPYASRMDFVLGGDAKLTLDGNSVYIKGSPQAQTDGGANLGSPATRWFLGYFYTTLMASGLGVWGHAAPGAQPAAAVTLADVIVILKAYGLCA